MLLSTRRALAAALALALVAGIAACGGGADLSKAQVRLVNASIDHGELDLRDGEGRRVRAAVAFGGAEGYGEVDPKDADLDVTAAGSATALASTSASLSEGDHYTLVAYASRGNLSTALLNDEAGDADAGESRVRVLNASPDAGDLDIYLTTTDADLATAEPLHAEAAAGTVTAFATTDAATWRLRVTAAGDRNDLRLDLPAVTLGSRQVVTLVLAPTAGGMLVDAIVLVQQGGVTLQAGTDARVRVVAGATASGAVSASVAGVALLNGTGSPAASTYRLVPAGDAAASAGIDGQEVAVPAQALAAGRDYTLLVYGSAADGQAAWLADDNRLPTVTGRVKLRLVHGLADVDDALALTLDFNPVADGVTPGSASVPLQVDAVGSGTLSVTAPVRGSPVWTAAEQLLLADGVYTLFVVGSEAAPTGILRKDR